MAEGCYEVTATLRWSPSGLCGLQQFPTAAPQPAPKVFSEADVTKAQEEITHNYQNKGFEAEKHLTSLLSELRFGCVKESVRYYF
jgi:hypothetical protein